MKEIKWGQITINFALYSRLITNNQINCALTPFTDPI